MFKLYGRKGAGSMAVEAMLALCGAPFTVTDVERDADRKFPEWFIKLNPMAQVPVLILPGDSLMTESAAMLIHLADSFPRAGLAPGIASALRPRYLRWLMFLATTVYMSDLRMYYPQRYTGDPQGAEAVKSAAIGQMAREWEVFAAALGNGPFILGEAMSAADLYAAMLATWNPDVPAFFARHANVKALYDRVVAHPAVGAVWKRHGL